MTVIKLWKLVFFVNDLWHHSLVSLKFSSRLCSILLVKIENKLGRARPLIGIWTAHKFCSHCIYSFWNHHNHRSKLHLFSWESCLSICQSINQINYSWLGSHINSYSARKKCRVVWHVCIKWQYGFKQLEYIILLHVVGTSAVDDVNVLSPRWIVIHVSVGMTNMYKAAILNICKKLICIL